jgi:hypothetical protein
MTAILSGQYLFHPPVLHFVGEKEKTLQEEHEILL